MKKTLIFGALLALPVIAMAQTPAKPSMFDVRFGYAAFANKSAKDAAGNGFTVGLGYGMNAVKGLGTGATSIDFDADLFSKNGGKVTALSLQAVTRQPFTAEPTGAVKKGFDPYYGIGIGVFNTKASGNGTSQTKTTVGGSFMLGAKVAEQVKVEAFYRLRGKINGTTADTYGVGVGFHF